MQHYFDQYPEFIENDPRRFRYTTPITIENVSNRHEAMLPESLVKGKTVLDLGSCLGASGHWALAHGATSYVGVDVQDNFIKLSNELLGKYWSNEQYKIIQQDLDLFLDDAIENNQQYDIVLFIGVIFYFLDHYNLLRKLSKVCKQHLIVDGMYPYKQVSGLVSKNASFIDIVMNTAAHEKPTHHHKGLAGVPSPEAVTQMLKVFGFANKNGFIYPKHSEDPNVYDPYTQLHRRDTHIGNFSKEILLEFSKSTKSVLPTRWLIMYERSEADHIVTLHESLVRQDEAHPIKDFSVKIDLPDSTPVQHWEFDDEVASRFQLEAETHIPDYHRVIDLSIDVVSQLFKEKNIPGIPVKNLRKDEIKIVDVGSALGFTMKKFIDNGYTNMLGVDSSESMRNQSMFKENVILSDTLPKDVYNVVLANWTLHFVKERRQYLQDIFDCLDESGVLILTDKMDYTVDMLELYENWKRNNGVSEEVILQKRKSLVGILNTMPLDWYLKTLEDIGYTEIEVINSRFMFHTILARKC